MGLVEQVYWFIFSEDAKSMLLQNLKNVNNKSLIVEADLVDSEINKNDYDHNQIEDRIQSKDFQVELLNCIGQTSALIGVQIVSSHYLLSIGTIGLYPVSVVLIPVFGSVAATLTNINFGDGIRIENKYKFPGQILRSSVLALNATKIILDNKAMDDIANKSFEVVVRQERVYRNLPEPRNIDLVFPVLGILIAFSFAFLAKKGRSH
ncbi:MAG: hypothetical protein ACKPE3_40400 [Sphaerospermopsis kisseleviana]